jgi:hypothetical protein
MKLAVLRRFCPDELNAAVIFLGFFIKHFKYTLCTGKCA